MKFLETKNVYDYKNIFGNLVEDFGYIYYDAILRYCGIIDNIDNRYWKIWLIKDEDVIGICGLWSQKETTDELWLGWFGIIPEHRNKNIGVIAMDFMKDKAKELNCKIIYSYVDKNGKPLSFYYRYGFENIGRVGNYLMDNPEASENDFESVEDYVIKLCLNKYYKN